MSDVTMAPTQDAIAESLLGDPQEQQVAEQQPAAEQQPEVQEEALPVEQYQPTEEIADDWLPTEQEKVWPDEVLVRYAQRYGLDEGRISDPLIRQLLHDKINSDAYINQLREQEEAFQQQQQVEVEQQPEPTQQPLDRNTYFQNLANAIVQRTDPEVARQFHSEFLGVWNMPPEQQPMAFAQVASKYMLNLMNTFAPDLIAANLQNQLSQAFPGFGEMYERSYYAMAWDRVRNSNPAFADLPAYGSKQFSQQLREAATRIPGFDEMQFTDPSGKPLSPMDNAARKYGMLAQAIKGQVDPAVIQRAAQALNNNQRRAAVRRSAGNLGSGQSKSASGQTRGSSQFQSNTDIFDDETMELWQREHGRI